MHINQIEAEPTEATEINGGLPQFEECGEDTWLGLNRALENASAAVLLDNRNSVADTVEQCVLPRDNATSPLDLCHRCIPSP